MTRSHPGLLAGLALATALAALPAAGQATVDTLAKIRAAKAIGVAFSGDSPPYSFVGKGDRPDGYAIDLCRKVIEHVGRAAGVPDLKVAWLVGTAAERVQMVASGKADLDCANTTATQARMRSVDFSSLVFVETGGFLVVAGGSTRRLADLGGKRIGVLAGTTTEARLLRLLRDRSINAAVLQLKDGNEGVAMLESGSLDVFAGDKLKLAGLARHYRNPDRLKLLGEDLSYEPLAFALPRGDSAFRLEVNKALTRVYAGGEIDAVLRRWFGDLGEPTQLLTALFTLNSIPE